MSENSTNNKNNIVVSNLNDYESVYKVDLNFDTNITGLDSDVMSKYINRVLGNHPYYIDTNQIVDLIVNEETNQVTVIVSSKDESDKLIEFQNNAVQLRSVVENDIDRSIYGYPEEEKLDLKKINEMYPDTKRYVLEHTNKDGKTQHFEYDFTGFEEAEKMYYNKNVELDGNKTRHFLKNNEGNPYYYNEDTNSSINYVNNNDISIDSGVYVNNVNLHNPGNVKRKLVNVIVDGENVNDNDNSYLNNENNDLMNNDNLMNSENNLMNSENNLMSNNNLVNLIDNLNNEEPTVPTTTMLEEAVTVPTTTMLEEAATVPTTTMLEEAATVPTTTMLEESKTSKILNYAIVFLILLCVLGVILLAFNNILKHNNVLSNNSKRMTGII